MNERQQIAIGDPCATPADTLRRQFYRTHAHGETTLIVTCLTINK